MATASKPTTNLQGVESPDVEVSPDFYKFTRRLRFPMAALRAFQGLGTSDSVALRQTGVISKLMVRVVGTFTATAGAATTSEYPYNLVRRFRVSANGQSNLINISGVACKAVNVFSNPALSSNGVARAANQAVGAASVQNGTMSLPSEDWGTNTATNQMGPAVTALTAVTYTVELYYEIPIAFDQLTLIGAIYAQTNATQLTLDIDWETHANLAAAGTLTPALSFSVVGEVFTIPNVGGRYLVPDLSTFHSLTQWQATGLSQGDNELNLPGTGVGRQLMRLFGSVQNGTAPGAPLAVTAANYSNLAYRYGGNDTPELIPSGIGLRHLNAVVYNEDIGRLWGMWCFDFATAWALRDSIDQGSTTDLRAVVGLVATPTNGVARLVQQTLFAAPVGA